MFTLRQIDFVAIFGAQQIVVVVVIFLITGQMFIFAMLFAMFVTNRSLYAPVRIGFAQKSNDNAF